MREAYSTLSEQELVVQMCQRNNELAFAELYHRHVRALIQIAIKKTGSKTTAEDLVQEVFFKFWMGRQRLDIEKNASAYLQGMLKNTIITHYYREQKKQVLAFDDLPAFTDDHTREHVEYNMLSEFYEQSLQKLPDKCRAVFILSRRGYSLREIASQLSISEKTAEAHISKALRILRVEMKDYIAFALIGTSFL